MSDAYAPSILSNFGSAMGVIQTASPWSLVLTGLLVGLGAGFFEELGWTGFAIPTMRARTGLFTTGFTVGMMWGAWHFLAVLWGSANAIASTPIPLFLLVALFSFLPPYRLLMVWVYEQTGSTLIGIIMHACLTSGMIILGPTTKASPLIYDGTFALVLWVAVAFAYGRSKKVSPAT